jgi:hypothetical protein
MKLIIETYDIHLPRRITPLYRVVLKFHFCLTVASKDAMGYTICLLYNTLRKYAKQRVVVNEIHSDKEDYPCLVQISSMMPSEVSKVESWLSFLLVNEPSGFINHMLAQVDTDEAMQDIIFNQLLKSPRILKTYLEI